MKTVAIAGAGLIGSSFGLAIRKAGFNGEILGVSSSGAIEAALRIGAISAGVSLTEAAQRADLIYLAQPVDRILESLETLGPIAPADCLITDAGSTKSVIVQKAARHLRAAIFLGGHPVAGKEKRGAEAAEPDLFQNRPYVLTPTAPESAISREFRLWLDRIGARVLDMTPEQHDETLAFTSHLPQLLSTALARTLARQSNPYLRRVFGAGLLDMTRLALSSAELWQSIVDTNREEIIKSLALTIDSLAELKENIRTGTLAHFFASGADFAEKIRALDSTQSQPRNGF